MPMRASRSVRSDRPSSRFAYMDATSPQIPEITRTTGHINTHGSPSTSASAGLGPLSNQPAPRVKNRPIEETWKGCLTGGHAGAGSVTLSTVPSGEPVCGGGDSVTSHLHCELPRQYP